MEPRREEQKVPKERRPEEKPKRFHLIKLEERIAPRAGGNGGTHGGKATCHCSWDTCTLSIE
jgi:hypothetical protein